MKQYKTIQDYPCSQQNQTRALAVAPPTQSIRAMSSFSKVVTGDFGGSSYRALSGAPTGSHYKRL